MTPSLARRGKLVLASGASFVLIGALYGSSPLVVLGAVAVSSLLTAYLWFFPAAILLRRRKVELSWWIPPGDQPGGALAVDRPFLVHCALRNHGARRLRVLSLDVLATAAIAPPTGLEAVVPARHQVEIHGRGVARAAGYHVLHGAVFRFGDILGLFELRAYFPNPVAIKVFPRRAGLRGGGTLRPSGATQHEQVGLHQVRRRGLAGELREIREHSHGDPFKMIAWKATARRQRLMVRDLETEIVVTHQFLLDIGGHMRGGAPGRSKLDHGIETITALARSALDTGDRAGLVTFDTRVYAELRAGEGHQQYLKIIDRLLETHNVVDEDLTELTTGELVSAVARYLAHQEAVDVRLRRAPALDDPAWERIHAGPTGELYDLDALGRIVGSLLRSMDESASRRLAPAWWWSRVQVAGDGDPEMARLRLFCRLRGIELPYRREPERGRRAAGLAEALRRAASGPRYDSLVLISDLGGLLEDPEVVSGALARARRAGQLVVALVPQSASFAPAATSEVGSRVLEVFARDDAAAFERAKAVLARHGIPALPVGPDDVPSVLEGRIARARRSARRVA